MQRNLQPTRFCFSPPFLVYCFPLIRALPSEAINSNASWCGHETPTDRDISINRVWPYIPLQFPCRCNPRLSPRMSSCVCVCVRVCIRTEQNKGPALSTSSAEHQSLSRITSKIVICKTVGLVSLCPAEHSWPDLWAPLRTTTLRTTQKQMFNKFFTLILLFSY